MLHVRGRVPGDLERGTPVSGALQGLAGGPVGVVQVRLDEEPAPTEQLARCLSVDERRRAERFVFERDRRRFVVCRSHLRRLIGDRLDVHPAAIEFAYGARGKPRLGGAMAGAALRFNVSHSAGIALYAFAWGLEVGVDVEAVCALPDADQVAARFFSRRENEAYRALDARDRPLGFFNCWTRKEAFVKALGDGLHFPLDAFDVSLAPGEPAQILRVGETLDPDVDWCLESLALEPGTVAAVVVEKAGRTAAPAVASSRQVT